MSQIVPTLMLSGCLSIVAGCGNNGDAQPIDMSNFDDFTFSRDIQINKCFAAGDLDVPQE